MTKRVAVLFSGGMDSLCTYLWAVTQFGKENVTPVCFHVGQRYGKKEEIAVAKLEEILGMTVMHVVLPKLPEYNTATIPYRNALFIMLAASILDADGVAFGMLRGESPKDKNMAFVENFQAFMRTQGKSHFRIYVPWGRKTKNQMLEWLTFAPSLNLLENYHLGIRLRALYVTTACHSATEERCGNCSPCFNRWVAMTLCSLLEEEYTQHPSQYAIKFLRGGTYGPYTGFRWFGWLWQLKIRFLHVIKALSMYHGRSVASQFVLSVKELVPFVLGRKRDEESCRIK